MKRRKLEPEVNKWLEQGIIDEAQKQNILNTYSEQNKSAKIIPILASILLGIGMLTFIASDWSNMGNGLKIFLLIGIMSLLYGVGYARNNLPLIGLGVVSFGASIILVGQIAHLESDNVNALIAWEVAAFLTAAIFQNKGLTLLGFVIANGIQLYSFGEFQQFNYIVAAVLIITLGCAIYKLQSSLLTWAFGVSLLVQWIGFAGVNGISWSWMWFGLVVLYVGSEFWPNRFRAIQWLAILISYVFALVFAITGHLDSDLPNKWTFAMPVFALFLISVVIKKTRKKLYAAYEWVLLLPWFELPKGTTFEYLIVLAVFSLYVMFRGYARDEKWISHAGLASFLLTTFMAYVSEAYKLLPKSLSFLVGGLILYAVYYILKRLRLGWAQREGEQK